MTRAALGIIAPHPPIMVPEVGGANAAVTRDSESAMHIAAAVLADFAPETLVLMSPHAPAAYDGFIVSTGPSLVGDLRQFGAASVRFEAAGDPELAAAVLQSAAEAGIPALAREALQGADAGMLDHGAMVPLYFLDRESRYAIVELSLSGLPLPVHHAFGRAIARAVESVGRRAAFVASGDCSHRLTRDASAGYSPQGARFDARLVEIIRSGDLNDLEHIDPAMIEAAGECGLRSFVTLAGYLDGMSARTRLLSYEDPWGVGYLTAIAGDAATVGIPGGDEARRRSGGTARGAVGSEGSSREGSV